MRYIDTTGAIGLHWNRFARLRTIAAPGDKVKLPPSYGKEGPEAHDELRVALARRQGFLCGFCMGHLDCRDKDGNLTWHKVKVAHLVSQSLSKGQKKELHGKALTEEEDRRRKLGIDHTNMVLACQGNTPGVIHCDAHQHERDIKHIKFNSQGMMAQVTFPADSTKPREGLLVKGPVDWQAEIGALEVRDDDVSLLNLNNKALCRNRGLALQNMMMQLKREDNWNLANYRRWLNFYTTPDEQGRLPAYCQVMIRALEKKIQQHA
jgi:hypothetical protein